MQTRPPNTKLKTNWIRPLLSTGCFLLATVLFSTALAATDPLSFSTWFVDMNQYADGAHGKLACQECHGPMIDRNKNHPDPESADFLKHQTKRSFDYGTCKKCHKTAHERFLAGEHAAAALKEKTGAPPSKTGFAPSCGDCHSSHYSKSHRSRTQIGKEMTETCGSCHPEQRSSFLENYHGKAAVNLGYDKAALCTDCHGAHTTLSLKDDQAALTACKRCHWNAGPEFASIIIHDSPSSLDQKSEAKKSGLKRVHWLGTLSLIFVVAVLLFFYLHTGLLMLRKLHEKLRKHK